MFFICVRIILLEVFMSSISSKKSEIIKLCFLLREFYSHKILSKEDMDKLNLLFNLIESKPIGEWEKAEISKFSSLNKLGIYVSCANGGTLEIKDSFSIIGNARHTFLYYDTNGIFYEHPFSDMSENDIFYDRNDPNQLYISAGDAYYGIFPYKPFSPIMTDVVSFDFDFPKSYNFSFSSRDAILSAVKAKNNIENGRVDSNFACELCSVVSNYIYHLVSTRKTEYCDAFINEIKMHKCINEMSSCLFLKYCETGGNFYYTQSSFSSELLRNLFIDIDFKIIFENSKVSLIFIDKTDNPDKELYTEHLICKINDSDIFVYPANLSRVRCVTHYGPYIETIDADSSKDSDDIFNHGGLVKK